MRIRWGAIVTIGVLAVLGAGAVLSVAQDGRGDHSTSLSGGSMSLADGGVSGEPAASTAIPKEAGDASGAASDAVGTTTGLGGLPTPELRAQVVKRAALVLEVGRRHGPATVREVIDAVGVVGGFVESTDQSDGRARLTIRVPADQFDATLDRLESLGRERNLEVHGQDVTGAVTDLEARLRNQRAQEAVLLELMRKATTIGDSIAVQQQLSQVQEQIEQLDGQRRALADQTTFATLVVSITPKGAPAPGRDSSSGLGGAWADAVDAAVAVTGGVLVVIGALLPILVIGTAGALVWRFVLRRPRRPTLGIE